MKWFWFVDGQKIVPCPQRTPPGILKMFSTAILERVSPTSCSNPSVMRSVYFHSLGKKVGLLVCFNSRDEVWAWDLGSWRPGDWCNLGFSSWSLAPPDLCFAWYPAPHFQTVFSIWDAKANVCLTWSTQTLSSLGLPLLSCTCLRWRHGILYPWNVYGFIL